MVCLLGVRGACQGRSALWGESACLGGIPLGIHPPVNRQTPVKTLPSRNFVWGGNNSKYSEKNRQSKSSLLGKGYTSFASNEKNLRNTSYSMWTLRILCGTRVKLIRTFEFSGKVLKDGPVQRIVRCGV